MNSPIVLWLREPLLPILINKSVKYPQPDQGEASSEALFYKQGRNVNAFPGAPPLQELLLLSIPGQVGHLNWWLTKHFTDHVDIIHTYAQVGIDQHLDMQLKMQTSPNPSVFITRPKVCRTGLPLTTANHEVIAQRFWVLNKQCQVFA